MSHNLKSIPYLGYGPSYLVTNYINIEPRISLNKYVSGVDLGHIKI